MIRESVAHIRGRLEQLPVPWSMITTMIGGQIALAGILYRGSAIWTLRRTGRGPLNGWTEHERDHAPFRAAPTASSTTPMTWWWSGAGGVRPARHVRHGRGGAEDGLHHQGVPDPQPHGRRAGRHRRRARQHGRGRLALAHVRHREGVGLARRPGRDRIHVPRGDPGGLSSSSTTACRSAAPRTAASTSARSAATCRITARRRRCAPAPRPTAPAMRSCTRCTSRA